MPLKRTAALAITGLVVLGGGATAVAATGSFASASDSTPTTDSPIAGIEQAIATGDTSTLPSFDAAQPEIQRAIDDALGDVTVDPTTGAISSHGITVQTPVTAPDGSTTFSGTGPDGTSHSATITPGADGELPTITFDGTDIGSMIDRFLADHPEIHVPDASTTPSMPPISVPSEMQPFVDQFRDALSNSWFGGGAPSSNPIG